MDLIILPFHDWKKNEAAGLRNRDGHLIAEFLRSERVDRVLVVDRPISLPERLLKRRSLRCRSGEEIARSGEAILSRIEEKLFVVDIGVPDLFAPLHLRRDWWDAVLRRRSIINKIRWAAQEAGLDEQRRALIVWSPLATGPMGRLQESAALFDAIDNWCRHPEMNDRRGWIRRGYRTACRKADALTCNSERTAEFLATLGGEAEVIRNGVDVERWDPEQWRAEPVPEDMARLPRPWIGYSGRLAKRTNVRMIDEIAARRPEWSFVLIGPMLDRRSHAPLRKRGNVYLLGDKHYDRLPGYVAHFDVAAIMHNVGRLENDGDPTKLYEYLALGLPVVTTPIAGVKTFERWIAISGDAEGFELEIAAALERRAADPRAFDGNREAVANRRHSWSAKAERMLDLIEGALEKKQSGEKT